MDVKGSDFSQSRFALSQLQKASASSSQGDSLSVQVNTKSLEPRQIQQPQNVEQVDPKSTATTPVPQPELASENTNRNVGETLSTIRQNSKTPPVYLDTVQRIHQSLVPDQTDGAGRSPMLPNTRHNPGASVSARGQLVDVIG